MLVRLTSSCCIAALLGVGLAAQRPSSWNQLALSAPLVAANINQLGKTCAYLETGKINFFSAFSREWKQAPVAATAANVRVFNDLAFVVEPTQITAFSSYRGTVEVLPVSAAAVVLNPVAQRNDSILAVQDGTTLWTFSCFRGSWTSRTLASASPLFVTQRHVALLAEGTTLWAMSAFEGTWSSTTMGSAATTLAADGSWGVAETSGAIYGFSAQRNTFSSTPALGAPVQTLKREDCVVYWDSTQAVAYTGLRGAFAATPLLGPSTVTADALVVAVASSSAVQTYSAVLASWSTTITSASVTPIVQPHLVVWNDGGIVSAYSPFLGTVAKLSSAVSSLVSNQGVASAVDLFAKKVFIYSTLIGAWVTAPADVRVEIPSMIWCGALCATATGFSAFSGRTGRFVPLPASATAVTWIDGNSSVIAVEETSKLSIYEPRRETWLSVAKVNPIPLQVRIWRTTLLAIDGTTVHGFGTFAGEIESHVLPAPPTEITANSESVRAGVGTALALFGGTPDMVTLYQFPEFRRVYTLGSNLEVQLHGAPGSQAWALFGLLAAAPIAVPPFGNLLVDPGTLAFASLGALPADGRVAFKLPLPDVAVLRGVELAFQGLVQPMAGVPYLTRLATVGLH